MRQRKNGQVECYTQFKPHLFSNPEDTAEEKRMKRDRIAWQKKFKGRKWL